MAMSSQSRRRRRRRRSSNARVVRPVRTTGALRFQGRSAEVLASIGVLLAGTTLVILVWLIASHANDAQRNDLLARTEATLTGQSLVLAEQVRREMLGLEQSLRILKTAFEADPPHFDMRLWREQMPALTDVADDVFIADAQFIVRHDINPQEVGLAIGTRLGDVFGPATGTPDRDEGLLLGPTMQKVQTRQLLTYMTLRLNRPGGWLVGAAYRTNALSRLFSEAGLGLQGLTALVDTRLDRLQAVAGSAAENPDYDIAQSPMYAAIQTRPDGTWIGPSAPDGVQRIHAFRHVPGRQLEVVVAVSETQAMRPAVDWAESTSSVALSASFVIAAGTALGLLAVWNYRSKRRMRQGLAREQALVVSTRQELGDMRTRAEGRAGQVQTLIGALPDGVALLDGEQRLAEWNQAFPELFGIPADRLQPHLPLDELLRTQANEGVFGGLGDIETEVARRLIELNTVTGPQPRLYAGPAGRLLVVSVSRHADGSQLLIMREAADADLPPPIEERAATTPQDVMPASDPGRVETL